MKATHALLWVAILQFLVFGFLYLEESSTTTHYTPSVTTNIVVPHDEHLTTYTPMYVSLIGEYEPLDIQCPIPMENRVPNFTGIQCVWSSIEMIGRRAEEPKLTNPPLTTRSECKSYASPTLASRVLTSLNVRFEQSYGNRDQGIALIKKAMAEGRGCLFGVPGHAMVLVHYDEETSVVKYVDNSDSTLKVQTMTMERFIKAWDTWALVIYADNDIVPQKIARIRNYIPIVDRNNAQEDYPRDYIPVPQMPSSPSQMRYFR